LILTVAGLAVLFWNKPISTSWVKFHIGRLCWFDSPEITKGSAVISAVEQAFQASRRSASPGHAGHIWPRRTRRIATRSAGFGRSRRCRGRHSHSGVRERGREEPRQDDVCAWLLPFPLVDLWCR